MKRLWKFIHNVFAHPLLELPFKLGYKFHDWTAHKAFGHEYLIWWLTPEELSGVESTIESSQSRLLGELRSAQSRNGFGSLWDGIGSNLTVDSWPETGMGRHCSSCVGIVIEYEEARHLDTLPGVLTDFKLRRV